MNEITFSINNGRTLRLIQRAHDGKTLIVVEDKNGNHENIPDNEAFISPGDFVMLVNHFRICKQNGTEIL